VNLDPTAEQRELAAAAARFLAAELPVTSLGTGAGGTRTHGARAGAGAWQKMAELGWLAIGVPAVHGGAGGAIADQALLFRELGRGLAPGPLLGTVLGILIATAGGRDDLAASLMAGEATAALAEPWRDPRATVSASHGASGRFRILDVDDAVLVTVLTADGACLVQAGGVRLAAHDLPAPDPAVPVSLAQLSGVRAEVVVDSVGHPETVAARGQVLCAALLVGILEAVRDRSVAYVSTREQFGKPIGSFQAVKHRCADMAVRAEAAGSLLWLAALSLDKAELGGAPGDGATPGDGAAPGDGATGDSGERIEARRLAASVKALASEYAVASAHDNVQNHGGMGFTAECSAHWYVKRALEWSATLGSPEMLLAEVAR
jgi:alkylation response protein AidB-like acyl-CoA dehydrogenase